MRREEMKKNGLRSVIGGLLAAVALNLIGWGLAFCAGADKPPIRPGWGQGLLSNIPLGIMIIIAMLIYVFDDTWTD
jgi:hypothetical protein